MVFGANVVTLLDVITTEDVPALKVRLVAFAKSKGVAVDDKVTVLLPKLMTLTLLLFDSTAVAVIL